MPPTLQLKAPILLKLIQRQHSMQATLLSTKQITTKFGEKVLAEVQLDTGESVQIWETPKPQNCISTLAVKSLIEVEKTAKGGYKWVAGALTGQAKKKAMAEYGKTQIRFLAYLHKQTQDEFSAQGIDITDDLIEKYAVTVYLSAKKEFNL